MGIFTATKLIEKTVLAAHLVTKHLLFLMPNDFSKFILSLCFLLLWLHSESVAQSMSINSSGSAPDPSAMLDVVATDKGMLIPRTDTTTVNASRINLAEGLLIYQNSDNTFYFYNGSAWKGINGTQNDNQKLDVASLSGTNLQLSLEDDGEATKVIDLSSIDTDTDDQKLDVASLSGTNLQLSLTDDSEATKSIDLSSINTDNQLVDVFSLSGTTLQLSLENDGKATETVDLSPLQNISLIRDADNNTKIQVEESTNDNTIRFDLDGTEYFRMKAGRLDVINTGSSVFFGESAGISDDLTDNRNVYIGLGTGKSGTTANNNVGLGYSALTKITSGNENTAIGSEAQASVTNGFRNVGVGFEAQNLLVGGSNNVAMGYQAMRASTAGAQNTIIGHEAGESNTGSNNVFLGYRAGQTSSSSSGNVFLGYRAGQGETDGNRLYIENSSSSSPLIYGEFDNDLVQINGKLSTTQDIEVFNTRDLLWYLGSGSSLKGSLGPALNSDLRLKSESGWLRLGATNSSIAFFTDGNVDNNSNPQMVLDEDGELGIGTTSPSTDLDVNGTVRIRGGSPATGDVLIATDGNGNATWDTALPTVGFTQTTGTTSYDDSDTYRQVTNTVSVTVESGDFVKIEGQVVARLTQGSNGDTWGLRASRTGSCGSANENLIEFTPSEDNDGDHTNFRPYNYLDYYVATCNGTITFALYLRNTGDDEWQVQDRTLIVTVIPQ